MCTWRQALPLQFSWNIINCTYLEFHKQFKYSWESHMEWVSWILKSLTCLFCQVTSLKMLKRSVGSMSLDHGMVLLCEQKSWYLEILVHCVVLENIHAHPKECYWKFQGRGGSQKLEFLKKGMNQNWNFQRVRLPDKVSLEVYIDIFWNNLHIL